MSLGKRIRTARKDAGFKSQQALAVVVGCTREAVTMWETDKVDAIGGEYLPALARALKRSVEYIQTGKEDSRSVVHANVGRDPDWRDIRGFAQAAGLGDGAEAEEYAVAHALKFRTQSLSRKRLQADKLCVFYGKGDSMLPRIQPGDAILFDTTDTKPRDGMIYVIMWKGEYYAKRAELLDDAVYFRTDNPSGDHGWQKPRRMDNTRDPIQIIGRVRWIGSWED